MCVCVVAYTPTGDYLERSRFGRFGRISRSHHSIPFLPLTRTLLTRPGEPRGARKAADPPASTKNCGPRQTRDGRSRTLTLPISLTWHWSTRIARQGYDIKHIVLQVFITQGGSNRRPRNKHYVKDISALTTQLQLCRGPIKNYLLII